MDERRRLREVEVADAEDHAKATETWVRTAEALRRISLLEAEVELIARRGGRNKRAP